MSWTRAEMKRSYPCNSELIKYLRERKNWSQKQLAKASGYCERLICKAESGGSISSSTIDVLAKTLSSQDLKIHPEDLISDPVALAKKFIDAIHAFQGAMVKGITHFMATDVELSFGQSVDGSGGQRRFGVNPLADAFEGFFESQEIVSQKDYASRFTYYANGNIVIVWGEVDLRNFETGTTKTVNVTLRLHFEKGKLTRIDDRSGIAMASTASA